MVLDGHIHMLGASAGTTMLLSRWNIIYKEANPGLFTCHLCLKRAKAETSRYPEALVRTDTKSLLLHSVSQKKSQGQPILNVWLGNNIHFSMGGTAKMLWLMAIHNTLDGEVKISCP